MRINSTMSRNSKEEFMRTNNECEIEIQSSTILEFKYYGQNVNSLRTISEILEEEVLVRWRINSIERICKYQYQKRNRMSN